MTWRQTLRAERFLEDAPGEDALKVYFVFFQYQFQRFFLWFRTTFLVPKRSRVRHTDHIYLDKWQLSNG